MADPEFTLLGDALWLDFVNTAGGRSTPPVDRLADPPAFHRWTKAQKLRSDGDGASFDVVRRLRSDLRLLAEALHEGQHPPAETIAALNRVLAAAPGHHQLIRVGGEWRLHFAPREAPSAIVAIARSAAATLADPATFVRRCAGEACSFYFSDASTTQHRRFCDDQICGRHLTVERRRRWTR